MIAAFERRAYLVSGTTASPGSGGRFRVSVDEGRFRVRPVHGPGVVLNVALDDVRCQPVGRAGAVVVEVEQSPVLVDFTDRSRPGRLARVEHGLRGRLVRRAFMAAVADGGGER